MLNGCIDIRNFRFLFFCIVIFIIISSGNSSAQTPIWIETFGNTAPGACDSGTVANGFVTANGAWTVTSQGVNDTAANEWYISASEPGLPVGFCSTAGCYMNASYTDRTLHVGNVSNSPNALTGVICPLGDCGAVYDPGGFQQAVETHKRAESPPFFMIGGSTHLMVFNYIEVGDMPLDSDDVYVYFFDGTVWNYIGNPPRTMVSCGGSSVNWERYSIALPVIPVSTNVQVGFLWKNDNGGVGSSPSFAVDSIIVFSLDTAANITVSDTDICVNDCLNFFADTIGVGATYNWVFTGLVPDTSSLQNPTNICYPNPGTYGVQLIASKPGFTDTANVTIVVTPCSTPVADFYASDTVFCEHTCITFHDQSTNGPTGWNWSFPGGTPSTSNSPTPPQICYDTSGFYDVTLLVFNSIDSATLTKTAYIQVDPCPLPIPDFTSTVTQTCPQHCVSFNDISTNGPFNSHHWDFPGGTPDTSNATNPSVCYAQEGSYDVTLTLTNQNGSASTTKSNEVVVVFVVNATVSPDTAMYYGSSYQLNSGLGTSYSWTPTTSLDFPLQSDPIATPTQTTTYTVAIDSAGCVAHLTVTVTILHYDKIFVPNTFSPNGDGKNDYLFVRGNNFTKIEFTVYDRWGEQIFQSTNQYIGWDGTFKGEELNPGVFTWVATVTFTDNSLTTQSGSVTLVR